MCLGQGYNAVVPVRFEPTAPRSRVKHSTTEPLRSQIKKEGKDQKLIQSSTTPDPGYQWKSNKLTIRHPKREPRGQLFTSR